MHMALLERVSGWRLLLLPAGKRETGAKASDHPAEATSRAADAIALKIAMAAEGVDWFKVELLAES
jgi:hypothetical protein